MGRDAFHEPCPDRIIDDSGGAFAMGAVGGSAYHFLKGLYNSPRGERLIGGTQAVRMNAPRTAGSFAVWGGLFSTFDCTMVYVRQKEDPWNSIIAGAATGGLLQIRQGFRSASRAALLGGVFLALIEGAMIMLDKGLSLNQNLPMTMEEPADQWPGMTPPAPAQVPEPSFSGSSSWFGWGKKQESAANSGSKTEILESFDTPTPMPTFEYK